MSMELATQPLYIQHGKTNIENIDTSSSVCDIIENYIHDESTFICWKRQCLVWGIWKNKQIVLPNNIIWEEKDILEIRVFNESEELHLIYHQGHYIGRYIHDGTGKDCAFVDSFSRLWGQKVDEESGFVTLRDLERFLSMTIPCKTNKENFYGLVTRNYIRADEETGQAGYHDYRFVRIDAAERRSSN